MPSLLYHYASLKAFEGIMTSRSIWMSDVTKMNDPTELSVLLASIARFRLEMSSRSFRKRSDENYDEGTIKWLNSEKQQSRSKFIGEFELCMRNHFIGVACFTTKGDYFPQWDRYVGMGRCGVSIGFERSVLEKLSNGSSDIFECSYPTKAKMTVMSNRWVKHFFDKADHAVRWEHPEQVGVLEYLDFIKHASKIKNEAFEAEHEVRIVSLPFSSPHMRLTSGNHGPHNDDYALIKSRRSKKENPIKYVEFPFPARNTYPGGDGTSHEPHNEAFVQSVKPQMSQELMNSIKDIVISPYTRQTQKSRILNLAKINNLHHLVRPSNLPYISI